MSQYQNNVTFCVRKYWSSTADHESGCGYGHVQMVKLLHFVSKEPCITSRKPGTFSPWSVLWPLLVITCG
jgi:hypothetical protein